MRRRRDRGGKENAPPRIPVACDVALLRLGKELEVLLVRRANPPFRGRWALPGGFIELRETLEETARRELREETGVTGVRLFRLDAFGDPGRDPRGRVLTVVYGGIVPRGGVRMRAGSDAREVRWFPLRRPPAMAFDHGLILRAVRLRLRERMAVAASSRALLGTLGPKDRRRARRLFGRD